MFGSERTPPRFAGLALCCTGFVVALLLQAWRVASDFYYVFASSKTRGLAIRSLDSGGAFTQAVVGYVLILVLLHVLAGLACWSVARAAEYGFRLAPARRRARAVFASLLALAWLMLANAHWFPHSVFEPAFGPIANATLGPWPVAVLYSWLLLAAVVVILAKAAALRLSARVAGRPVQRVALPVAAVGLIAAAAAVPFLPHWSVVAKAAPVRPDARPNVIFVGIDSLRCDLQGLGAPQTLTPNVDAFLRSSHRFSDAITPLARTFPSWVATLTGRHPVTTGARINLTARAQVHEGETLPEIFRAAGYATALATDEVRFSNIDESYGYEQMITPRIGATDFLIGTVNDIPIANLATLLPISRHVFPDLYGNRAAYKTYRPDSFVRMFSTEFTQDERPVFLAVHLTLAHWPYAWADSARDPSLANTRPNYVDALRAVDAQYAAIMAELRRRGLLDNAIVVVMSDHGESVGLPNDSMLPRELRDDSRRMSAMFGHGTSVLGPHQYRVVLGMRAFGNDLLPADGVEHSSPVTLEDVAPTLLEITGHRSSDPFDGMSLAGLLRGEPAASQSLQDRFRFTETEYKPSEPAGDDQSARKIAIAAAHVYRVEQETGRFVLTDAAIRAITNSKELAVLRGRQKLAAVRDFDALRKYYWFDGRSAFPRVTRDRALLAADPEAGPLMAALERRFPGELDAPR